MSSIRNGTYQPRVLIYGAPKTGKTYFITTFPKPVFVFDFDGGWLTLLGREGVDGVSFADERGSTAFTQFEKLFNKVIEDPDIKTVAIDSLTTFGDHFMRYVLSLQGKSVDTVPRLQDWGQWVQRMKHFLIQVTAGREKGLVVTAHEQIVGSSGEDATGLVRYLPAIAGKDLPGSLPIYFDEVYYSQVIGTRKNPKWIVNTVGTSETIAGSRLARMFPIEPREPNDWGVIWSKVSAALKGGEQTPQEDSQREDS